MSQWALCVELDLKRRKHHADESVVCVQQKSKQDSFSPIEAQTFFFHSNVMAPQGQVLVLVAKVGSHVKQSSFHHGWTSKDPMTLLVASNLASTHTEESTISAHHHRSHFGIDIRMLTLISCEWCKSPLASRP